MGMQTFNSVVLFAIIDPHNVLTPHISKTHLAIVSLHLRELELMFKRPVKEKRSPPPASGVEAQLTSTKP